MKLTVFHVDHHHIMLFTLPFSTNLSPKLPVDSLPCRFQLLSHNHHGLYDHGNTLQLPKKLDLEDQRPDGAISLLFRVPPSALSCLTRQQESTVRLDDTQVASAISQCFPMPSCTKLQRGSTNEVVGAHENCCTSTLCARKFECE